MTQTQIETIAAKIPEVMIVSEIPDPVEYSRGAVIWVNGVWFRRDGDATKAYWQRVNGG